MGITLNSAVSPVATYQSPLIAVADGFVYIGQTTNSIVLGNNQDDTAASLLLRPDVTVQMCYLNRSIFIVDGTNIAVFDLDTNTAYQYYHLVSPQLIANPPTAVTGTASSGSLPARTYVVKVGYVSASGEVELSAAEATQVLTAGEVLTVTSPSSSTDVVGYIVYAGIGSGNETLQTLVPIAIGTDWQEPNTGLISGLPIPIDPAPTDCCLTCNWRGRFCLAGDANNPQNFYMSRAGNPTDWNYAALDAAAAVAGNLSTAGQIGEPIMALIPYTDDIMLIGCANSLWMLEGDLADGGSIVRVSDQMGILGPNAWTVDPQGTLYFIGRGGLYSVKPIWELYQPPQLLTGDSYDQFFQTLANGASNIQLVWDIDLKYMHVFVTPVDDATVGTHLIYDTRNGGLWPQQYPQAHGPTASVKYAANIVSGNRSILLGGWDGYIRQWTPNQLDDDGTAISASITIGPIKPNEQACVLSGMAIDFGEILNTDTESQWAVKATLNSGPDAYEVTEGTPHSTITVTVPLDRRQKIFRQRLRGSWFTLMLSNATDDTYFSFESATLDFIPHGRQRDIR